MDELRLGYRDAIHVPFIVVKCNAPLNPGDKCSLRLLEDERTIVCVRWAGPIEDEPMWHGVADPWRETQIPAGELFPVYLRKECHSGLRHEFTIEVGDRGGTSTCHRVCDIF